MTSPTLWECMLMSYRVNVVSCRLRQFPFDRFDSTFLAEINSVLVVCSRRAAGSHRGGFVVDWNGRRCCFFGRQGRICHATHRFVDQRRRRLGSSLATCNSRRSSCTRLQDYFNLGPVVHGLFSALELGLGDQAPLLVQLTPNCYGTAGELDRGRMTPCLVVSHWRRAMGPGSPQTFSKDKKYFCVKDMFWRGVYSPRVHPGRIMFWVNDWKMLPVTTRRVLSFYNISYKTDIFSIRNNILLMRTTFSVSCRNHSCYVAVNICSIRPIYLTALKLSIGVGLPCKFWFASAQL